MRRTLTFIMLVGLACLISAGPALCGIATLRVSPEQEMNFRALVETVSKLQTPAADKYLSALFATHDAAVRNDHGAYLAALSRLGDAQSGLTPLELGRVQAFAERAPRTATPTDVGGIAGGSCTVSCVFGSCSITCDPEYTPNCRCVWLFWPSCTCDLKVPAASPWGLGVLAVVLVGAGLVVIGRRNSASA
ncbi:MAG TPA: hypothetical protein VMS93_02880 [Candidatus Saccharimonadales bacterium]|nr:hypothetical protein [Candidatus Saccharimonadales bacterium]